jgi:chromosomal replication initiator protein
VFLETSVTQVQQEQIAGIVQEVHQQLSATSYDVWFKDATRFAVEGDELKIGVPNLFVCDYMETRFGKLIAGIANRQLGRDVSIRFVIDPSLFRERRQEELVQSQAFLDSPSTPSTPKPQPKTRKSESADTSPPAMLTLDAYVVGDCNRMAYAAALEVARQPGQIFNPLFIHGGCGLGKTHLLQGVIGAVRQRDDRARVLYITAEQFTNRYIMAVKTRSLDAFRHRFRNLDVLAIDDIHFLANKKATQEEFLHTFNAFDLGSRQVIMASDCHPKMLSAVQTPLVNRFVSGMVAKVAAPDCRTRVEILQRKARQMSVTVDSSDVFEFVARHVTGSVRELEGALIRVVAYASLDKRPITASLAREAMAEHISAGERRITLDRILDTVAEFFALPKGELTGRKRTRTVTLPRQLAMYLSRRHTPLSYPEIGRLMGGKNHTTVLAACKRVEVMIDGKQQIPWHDGGVKQLAKVETLLHRIEDRLRA